MVFAAFDETLDRRIALKFVHAEYADDPVMRQRFLDEARAMARVSHANVLQIHEAGESDGRLFLAPSRVVLARAEQRVLALALQRIPVDYQIALELYYWEDMTAPELAATLGLTEPAVRSRLRRALELLRKVLPEVAASQEESQSVSLDLEKWAASLQD
jgi:DNA-directed RNA polymerase specialized sigma24 family protein